MSGRAPDRSTFHSAYSTFVVCEHPQLLEILVRGEYDLASTDASKLVLQHIGNLVSESPRPVVVDLSDVSFFDAAGVSFLLRVDRVAQLVSKTLSVRDPSPDVRYLLEIVDLSGLIDADVAGLG